MNENKEIECPICLKLYNSDTCKPMILQPCNHSFCEACLLKCDKKICATCQSEWVSKNANYMGLDALERYDSLVRALGLENDEQTKQLVKILQTTKSINDVPVHERLKKMPGLVKEMTNNLNDLKETVRKELKEVNEVQILIDDLNDAFNKEVNQISTEFGLIKSELQQIKDLIDKLDLKQPSNLEAQMSLYFPSIQEQCKSHDEKITERKIQSELRSKNFQEKIDHCIKDSDKIKDVTKKRNQLVNSKLIATLGAAGGATGGGVTGFLTANALVASELLGGVGQLVILGLVVNPIVATALTALAAGVTISGFICLVVYFLKSKNNGILKLLESFYSNLADLSHSNNAFYVAVDEIYSKLKCNDKVEQVKNSNEKLKELGEVLSLINSFLRTVNEFKVRLDDGEFKTENKSVITKK